MLNNFHKNIREIWLDKQTNNLPITVFSVSGNMGNYLGKARKPKYFLQFAPIEVFQ